MNNLKMMVLMEYTPGDDFPGRFAREFERITGTFHDARLLKMYDHDVASSYEHTNQSKVLTAAPIKWENESEFCEAQDLDFVLSRLSDEGWEMVSVVHVDERFHFFYKRPVATQLEA